MRNKIDELRCLQRLCRFEVFAVTETRLNSSIPDTEISIPGMKHLRLDRKGRKGGGCMLFYSDHLKAVHRNDLLTTSLEAAWVQVTFASSSVLFAVIYRPPDDCTFFDHIVSVLEKAWLKTSNIVLLGDFKCDFKLLEGDFDVNRNTVKLRSIFEMFNMHNVV